MAVSQHAPAERAIDELYDGPDLDGRHLVNVYAQRVGEVNLLSQTLRTAQLSEDAFADDSDASAQFLRLHHTVKRAVVTMHYML